MINSAIHKKIQAIVIIVIIFISIAGIRDLFIFLENIGIPPRYVTGQSIGGKNSSIPCGICNKQGGKNRITNVFMGSGIISPEGGNPEGGNLPHIPLFNITHTMHTSYIRVSSAYIYNGSYWIVSGKEFSEAYNGSKISYDVMGYDSYQYDNPTVKPLLNFTGFIPVSLYTINLTLPNINISLYPEQNMFRTTDIFVSEYNFITFHYFFSESTLNRAEVVNNIKYLQVPNCISSRVRELAINITKDYNTPYEKIVAIVKYLRTNYRYDANYTRAPKGWEPNDWFLFEEKRGVCANFASAFVILARVAGIPSRIVSGYIVNNVDREQTVYANQAHAWAEVHFKGLGWITIDPTPGSCGICNKQGGKNRITNKLTKSSSIETKTIVFTVSPKKVKKGEMFHVNGETVTKCCNDSIDDMPIEIYLLKIENNSVIWGKVVGRGYSMNGEFNITCIASEDTYVGNLYIVAHSLGKENYLPSWSNESILTKTYTKISAVNPLHVERGGTIHVIGNVSTEYNKLLDNVNISIYISKTKDHNGILIGRGVAYNGTFDILCKIPHDIDIGTYHIIAYSHGKLWYLSSWSDPEIIVYTATVLTLSVPDKVLPKQFLRVDGKLLEESGKPLSNKTIYIYINNNLLCVESTDDEGVFTATLVFNRTGDYTVKALFKGGEYYLPSNDTKIIHVDVVNIKIYTDNTWVKGEDVLYSGKVFFGSRGLENEPIKISLDNEVLSIVYTDKEGNFSYKYNVTSISLGYHILNYTVYHFNITSTQKIFVISKTKITLSYNKNVIRGNRTYFHGSLTETDDTPIPNKKILIYVNGTLLKDFYTDDEGVFTATLVFNRTGDYTVKALFKGGEYYLPSNISAFITVSNIKLVINVCDKLVRGEVNSFYGEVVRDEKPLSNLSIDIKIGRYILGTVLTDDKGVFNRSFPLPKNETLGIRKISFIIPKYSYTYEKNIVVAARTRLMILNMSNEMEVGDNYTIVCMLLNDYKQPIKNITLTLIAGNRLFEVKNVTDKSGIAHFLINIPSSYKDDKLNISICFNGSKIYMPSKIHNTVTVKRRAFFNILIYIPLPIVAIIGALYYLSYKNRGVKLRIPRSLTRKSVDKVEEEHGSEELLGNEPVIKIVFPQIADSYPKVWEQNKPIKINILIEEKSKKNIEGVKVNVFIGDILIKSLSTVIDNISLTYVFEKKGEYEIKVEYSGTDISKPYIKTEKIRIIDVREEVINLYHTFIEYLKDKKIDIQKDMTPEEIKNLAIEAGFNKKYINNIIRYFEEAEYSTHQITMKKFRGMWFSINKVKGDKNEEAA